LSVIDNHKISQKHKLVPRYNRFIRINKFRYFNNAGGEYWPVNSIEDYFMNMRYWIFAAFMLLAGMLLKFVPSKIEGNITETKLCPFCDEKIKADALNCQFCNRILMKQVNFKLIGAKDKQPA